MMGAITIRSLWAYGRDRVEVGASRPRRSLFTLTLKRFGLNALGNTDADEIGRATADRAIGPANLTVVSHERNAMFSLCPWFNDEHEHGAAQIKGGYLLRYKRKLLWSSWSEEWVVLYDDSTMAWFKDSSGKCLAAKKQLVKEYPEMLAVGMWTGQIPQRPRLPPGAKFSQMMALGSRRHPGKVVWMVTKSPEELKEWVAAITKTLPPPPCMELIMSMPYLRMAFKRPTVRVRPRTDDQWIYRQEPVNPLDGQNLVAVIQRKVPLSGVMHHELAWGQGWGWVTNTSGIWSGRLSWTQQGNDFALYAWPNMHHTNIPEAIVMLNAMASEYCSRDLYEAAHKELYAHGDPALEQMIEDYGDCGSGDCNAAGAVGATVTDDWDVGVDCGDFMM